RLRSFPALVAFRSLGTAEGQRPSCWRPLSVPGSVPLAPTSRRSKALPRRHRRPVQDAGQERGGRRIQTQPRPGPSSKPLSLSAALQFPPLLVSEFGVGRSLIGALLTLQRPVQ